MRTLKITIAVALMLIACSCNLSSDIAKAEQIISVLPAAVDLIPPIVCVADQAACPGVSAAAKVTNGGLSALGSALSTWSASSKDAQPGNWNQVMAAMTSIQSSEPQLLAAAHVTNSSYVAEAEALTGAVIAEMGEMASIIHQIGGAGGTTAAAAEILNGVEFSNGYVCEDCQAIWSPQQVSLRSDTTKTKAGTKVHSKRGFKNTLLKVLSKRGDPKLDNVNAALARKVKTW